MIRLLNNATQLTDKLIVCKENKIELIFNCNHTLFYKIHLDDKIYNDILHNNPRCDYIIISKSLDLSLFVELKGNNIKIAIKQILSSKKQFGSNLSKVYAIIIYHSTPSGMKAQALKLKYKKYFTNIYIKHSKLNLMYKDNNIVEI